MKFPLIILILIMLAGAGCEQEGTSRGEEEYNKAYSKVSYKDESVNDLVDWKKEIDVFQNADSKFLYNLTLEYNGKNRVYDVKIITNLGQVEIPEVTPNSPIKVEDVVLIDGQREINIEIKWKESNEQKVGKQIYSLKWE